MVTVGIVGGQDAETAASRLRALGATVVLGSGSAVAFRIAMADTSGDTRFVDAVLTDDEPVHLQVERLWSTRLRQWSEALAGGGQERRPPSVQPHDPRWEWAGRRGVDRVRSTLTALDPAGVFRYDHIGSTSVRGLAAKPFIDLQVRVPKLPDPADLDPAMAAIGFLPATGSRPDSPGVRRDAPRGSEVVPDEVWAKRLFISPDPLSPTIVHVRRLDSPWGRHTVWFRDWLKAHPAERERYEQVKIALAAEHAHDADPDDYTRAKSGFFDEVHQRFEEWALRA
ncbi:GrpB family protein [Umezawaea endophytica]|uniref:GrpB family protein n=1 Tax=Umezawaea endophytica TaxID=1654476 RepID=A0A9X2VN71_9PSEU|nr:GrpB family protein [Umezawaea endophytica]MCS7479547.1 GrpB family protein [Umezawaea endophytica]